MVVHLSRKEKVTGSIPVVAFFTINKNKIKRKKKNKKKKEKINKTKVFTI